MEDNKQEHIESSANHSAEQTRDDVINKIAMAAITEQRKARRWGILWKSLTFIYISVFLLSLIGLVSMGQSMGGGMGKVSQSGKHTAIIDLNGVIANDSYASADIIIKGLQRAFENKNTAGVILRINSPGGSPVQSAQIYDEMQRLRVQYPSIPLHAVIEDVGASGGYFVAAGAEKIYANQSSLVGSIGVIMSNFGFVDAMEKLGVERRVLTAGDSKALGDPFSPLNQETTAHLQSMLGDVHEHFIAAVKKGRGVKLAEDKTLFSGLVWTAEKGIELGLVDGLGDIRSVARDEIGEEFLVNFTPRPNLLENFANRLGVSVSQSLSQLLWSAKLQ